jgi:hypothetical protein
MNERKRIKLRKDGVFLVTSSGEQRVAAPVCFHAIGERLDHTKVVELRFVDCDGERASEQFDMSAINPRNLATIADTLGNRGYLWPADGVSAAEILKAVVAKTPSRRFALVGAPGWYEGAIVTPLRCYGGTKRIIIDPNSGAHLAAYAKGSGSLNGWRKTVGRTARKSTGLRLAIAAALAAPLLRPLSMDSFALNLFAPTSTGKSSLLCAAASVPGLNNGTSGLPKWSESEAAIEQLAIGHRDGLLPLDESGDQGGKVQAHEKAKQLAFLFARNRAKTLDKSYQKKINLIDRDFRVIVLGTSEIALKTIAEMAGQTRIGGEEVRFIDVPVVSSGSMGVFDGFKVPKDRDPGEFGRMLADNLRREAETNQGFVLDAFLKKFVRDPAVALARIKHHMDNFTAEISLTLETGPDQRICRNFALIYAAAALGIEYGILPWKKKTTRADIEKCMSRALAIIRSVPPPVDHDRASIEAAVRNLRDLLDRLTLIQVEKGEPCSVEETDRRQRADGFRVGRYVLIKPPAWKVSNIDRALLIEHRILRTQRKDAATLDRKIIGIVGKRRYYVIDEDKLGRAIAARRD